ncbi:response regulator [Sulfitobacter sp. LCG007]
MTVDKPVVFVVDDDSDIRKSLGRALRMRGFTVETFDSARAFLDRYDPSRIGCLVLDYGMPGMSGLELQRHLNEAGNRLPIIFITGHGGVPESVQAMKAGAVDFLEKPFRLRVLAERITAACDMALERARLAASERTAADRFGRLTIREREIVDLILEQPSEATSKDIGRILGISPRTVDHHRARILEKLEVRSLLELVGLAQDTLR